MLSATFIAIFFIPLSYILVTRAFTPKAEAKEELP